MAAAGAAKEAGKDEKVNVDAAGANAEADLEDFPFAARPALAFFVFVLTTAIFVDLDACFPFFVVGFLWSLDTSSLFF